MNSGEKRGLWALFENEIRRIGSQVPLTKVWCSAHRMELVWGDVCKSHKIIDTILNQISSISSHFHKSGIRVSALMKTATENNLPVLMLPKLFTIRWTEFSHTIINNLLRSWHVLMIYFDANKEADATEMGYFRFLSKIENLRIIIADLLQIYSRHHKKTQDDKLTINNLVQNIRSLQNALLGLQDHCLLGRWEETLNHEIRENEEGKFTLKRFELSEVSETSRAQKNDFNSIRSDIIISIINRLRERFEGDDALMKSIDPFTNFRENANLRKIHQLFASDLDLSSLKLQFNELIDQNIPVKLNGDVGEIIKTMARNSITNNNYEEILTTLSRIYVCTLTEK